MRIASSFILLSISATLVSAWPFQNTKNVTASTNSPVRRLSKRAGRPTDDCNGVWLRATDGPTGKEITCKAGTKGYELAATNPRVLATTNLERDGQAKAVATHGSGFDCGMTLVNALRTLASVTELTP
ncbi:hypothetical protein EXIGLDRAFT_437168 [Exidia glandulosa HHB12029]|uniref:Ecp2 effector protein domain-containing protein n=1 Tax=Exidia glandulosa HHB12029 TaxID=1314781 RepID=A0A165B892_EXIGL|nr:hypothetical protein EXIGLDRAFT_437168 [Exidia glandulosa HHB12029]